MAFPLTELVNEKLGYHAKEHTTIDPTTAMAAHAESSPSQIAIDVSLDGWHTTRADLDKFPVSVPRCRARRLRRKSAE